MKELLRKYFPGVVEKYRLLRKKVYYYQKKYSTLAMKRRILQKEYKNRMGIDLHLENPKRYTEKIQWQKLYGMDERMSLLSDKYKVREWIKETIGEEYLLPMITAVRSFEEIDFDKLPNRFVIKSNNSSGWNIIVKNKADIDLVDIKEKINRWRKINYAYHSALELQYANIEPIFVIEEYVNDTNGELNDYKFMCFNGKVYYCWVDTGRFEHHTRTVYNLNWERQPWSQVYNPTEVYVEKPQNFDKMVELATQLCQGFSHVRVDLYNVDGKIYFGEMTFTNGNGLDKIVPDEYDEKLGELFPLEKGNHKSK